MGEVDKHAPQDIFRILLGNKIDLERNVTTEQGQEMANHYEIPFVETSAKDGNNVELALRTMVKEIKNRFEVQEKSTADSGKTTKLENPDNTMF